MIDFRLVIPDPEKLGCGIGRAEPVACDFVATLHPDPFLHESLLFPCPGICPDDHRPQRLSLNVHRKTPHHLGAEGNHFDLSG